MGVAFLPARKSSSRQEGADPWRIPSGLGAARFENTSDLKRRAS
jgi:hypothetical protein